MVIYRLQKMKTQDKLNMKENEVKRFKGINGMNSLEIAELTDREHKNVMRDIRELLSKGINRLNFELVDYKDKKGETRPCYNLTPKGCLILASGYDAVLREKIIDRLEELELQKRNGTFKVPQTFAQALRLAAEQQETIERQQRTIEVQKPKAVYFDSLVDRGLNVCFRDAAKEIGVKQKEFISYLIENKYVYRNKAGKLRPHADYNNDLFVVKDTKSDSNGWAGVQALVTPKGKETFRLLLNA